MGPMEATATEPAANELALAVGSEDAPARLLEALERARRGGTTVFVEAGRPVARVVPVVTSPATSDATGTPAVSAQGVLCTAGELARWWPTRPRLCPKEADALADDVEEARRLRNRPHVGFEWD